MATITGTANKDVLYIEKGKSNDTLLGLGGNDYLDTTTGAGNNILRGGDGDDELYAYTNDQLFGDAGDDKLYSDGNGGNTLSGGDGNDIIYADRNDTVAGDAGDDTIYAGRGGSTITGGAGKDVFFIANVDIPTTPNTITDFDRLNDTIRINLAGVSQFSDLTIAKSGNDATISFGTQQLAIVNILPTLMLRIQSGLLSDPWYPIGRFLSFKDGMTHRPVFYINRRIMVAIQRTSTLTFMPTILDGLRNFLTTTRTFLSCTVWIYSNRH